MEHSHINFIYLYESVLPPVKNNFVRTQSKSTPSKPYFLQISRALLANAARDFAFEAIFSKLAVPALHPPMLKFTLTLAFLLFNATKFSRNSLFIGCNYIAKNDEMSLSIINYLLRAFRFCHQL